MSNIRREASEKLFRTETEMREYLKPYFLKIGLALGQGQPRIFKNLFRREKITQKELSDACYLDTTTMSKILDKLENQGYLLRKRDEQCRRNYQIVLTDQGRKKAEEVSMGLRNLDETVWDGFDETEIREMEGYLNRILENIRKSRKKVRGI